MKKFSLTASMMAALLPFMMNAQEGINNTPMHSGGAQGQIMATAEKPMAATGSMYLDEKYMPARISGNDQTILVRYNAYSDYFEMNNPQAQRVQALPKQAGVNITMMNTGEVYTLQNFKTEKGDLENGYLNVVSENGKVKIYKRERVYLQPGSTSVNSYSTSKPAKYKKADDEFYVKINDGEAVFVSGKKDVANLVPGKSKEILDFIKKNKLDLEKETDLQQLSGYLETIL